MVSTSQKSSELLWFRRVRKAQSFYGFDESEKLRTFIYFDFGVLLQEN